MGCRLLFFGVKWTTHDDASGIDSVTQYTHKAYKSQMDQCLPRLE
jgi:hypothetical protein